MSGTFSLFSDLVKPTNKVGGYEIAPPSAADRYSLDAKGKPIERHLNGAYHEQKLAYDIHGNRGQTVVQWGDKIGATGADIVSVDPDTGRVTLWDAKYRSDPGKPFESETFTDQGRRAKAKAKAMKVLENNKTLDPELKKKALDSLRSGNYDQVTVRYTGKGVYVGEVSTPVPAHEVAPLTTDEGKPEE